MGSPLKKIVCGIFLALLLGTMLSGSSPVLHAKTTAEDHPIRLTYGREGLVSLKSGGNELLGVGGFDVKNVLFTRPDGTSTNRALGHGAQVVDVKNGCVTRIYPWGVVRCAFTPAGGRVDFDIAVSNRSSDILSGVLLQVLALKFAGGVQSFEEGVRSGSNVDIPTVVGVGYRGGALTVANDDVTRPLYFGLPSGDPKKPDAVFPLLAATYRDDVFPSKWMASPRISRPIYPGETDHLHLSLRVGPAGQPPHDLAADVYRKYAAAYPSHLAWKDRRPIGYLNLSVTVPHPDNGKNPRGWFNNDPAVDTTTPAGRSALQARLLELADHCIPILKATNAQGVIIWDIEGQEYPHAMSYVGDPRHLPEEIDPVADRFFQKFRDAGLRVGVCLRTQKPVKSLYGDIPEQLQVADNFYNLNDKITYAKKRWGCTLFYVDSNVHFDLGTSPSDEKDYELLPAQLFQDAALANPDVLLIPEQQIARYYAYGAPYDELKQNTATTPAAIRRIYPDAFTVISVATDTSGGPLDTRRAELIDSVRRGDILLFRAWYETPEMKPVQEIYKAAAR